MPAWRPLPLLGHPPRRDRLGPCELALLAQGAARAVRALLEFCIEQPEGAHLLCIALLAGGEEGARRYRATIDAVADRLAEPGATAKRPVRISTMTAALFLAPMMTASHESADRAELLSLESTFVELLLDLTAGRAE